MLHRYIKLKQTKNHALFWDAHLHSLGKEITSLRTKNSHFQVNQNCGHHSCVHQFATMHAGSRRCMAKSKHHRRHPICNQEVTPMDTQQAYEELGLHPGASDVEVKATWRRLVAAWHPDRNAAADAGRRMQLINKAYQHIRQVRDGEDTNDSVDENPGTERSAATASESDTRGSTHVRKVRLSLEDAVLGCTRTLRGQFTHICNTCLGKGLRVHAKACGTCRGTGAVRRAALFGWLWGEDSCADCGGDGRERAPCEACDGKGERSVVYRHRVRFPPGVREGHVLSLPTSLHDGMEIGLELQVEIEAHPLFELKEDGVLRCEMPVNGYAWMAGRWVDVPTPDGMQQMRLNRDALVYRLRGQGFPSTPRGPRGDYLVKVVPVFPAQEDPALDEMLDQLIARSTSTAAADRSQPLGDWQRRMKRWDSRKK
jgi:molecular chaperone DnaJ